MAIAVAIADILKTCALDFGKSWKKHLPLVESIYRNNYKSGNGMAPYETLYGGRVDHLYAG